MLGPYCVLTHGKFLNKTLTLMKMNPAMVHKVNSETREWE